MKAEQDYEVIEVVCLDCKRKLSSAGRVRAGEEMSGSEIVRCGMCGGRVALLVTDPQGMLRRWVRGETCWLCGRELGHFMPSVPPCPSCNVTNVGSLALDKARAWLDAQPASRGFVELRSLLEQAAMDERMAIVRWLLTSENGGCGDAHVADTIAACIEDGAHRKPYEQPASEELTAQGLRRRRLRFAIAADHPPRK